MAVSGDAADRDSQAEDVITAAALDFTRAIYRDGRRNTGNWRFLDQPITEVLARRLKKALHNRAQRRDLVKVGRPD